MGKGYVSDDGKHITCHRWAPKSGTANHITNRALCFFMPDLEICSQCSHSKFVVRVKLNIGHQVVYCPQFSEKYGWQNGETPVYVQMRRESCLVQIPRSEYCQLCPNRLPDKPPMQSPGWVEAVEKAKRKRRKAEEEEDEPE
jgi:hypothetical protein